MTNPNNPYGNQEPNDPTSGGSADSKDVTQPAQSGASLPAYGQVYGAFDNVPLPESYRELREGKNGWALSAFIIGILSVVSVIVVFGPLIVGTLGVIVAIVALVRGRGFARAGRRTWMSVTGLVLSILSFILMVIVLTLFLGALEDAGVTSCVTDGASSDQISQCVVDRMNSYSGPQE